MFDDEYNEFKKFKKDDLNPEIKKFLENNHVTPPQQEFLNMHENLHRRCSSLHETVALTGRPVRDTIISKEEITDLIILLETVKSVSEFEAAIA